MMLEGDAIHCRFDARIQQLDDENEHDSADQQQALDGIIRNDERSSPDMQPAATPDGMRFLP
jgi:hypothetical protein